MSHIRKQTMSFTFYLPVEAFNKIKHESKIEGTYFNRKIDKIINKELDENFRTSRYVKQQIRIKNSTYKRVQELARANNISIACFLHKLFELIK